MNMDDVFSSWPNDQRSTADADDTPKGNDDSNKVGSLPSGGSVDQSANIETDASGTAVMKTEGVYPVEPSTIQFVTMPKTYVNHTYRDFSNMPLDVGYTFPLSVDQMTFHEKLYHVLTFASPACHNVMKWAPHGRSFEIVSPTKLRSLNILRFYFGYDSLQRFYKQLADFGYKELTRCADYPCYYSEFLLRGMPHVLQYSPSSGKRRKLTADPNNEPDFNKIGELFPLPGGDRKELLAEARMKLQARGFVIYETVFRIVASGGKL